MFEDEVVSSNYDAAAIFPIYGWFVAAIQKLHPKGAWSIICDALRNLVTFVQFKNLKKPPWMSAIFKTLLKVTLLHVCFSRFLICTNGTKSRKTSHLFSPTANFYLTKTANRTKKYLRQPSFYSYYLCLKVLTFCQINADVNKVWEFMALS